MQELLNVNKFSFSTPKEIKEKGMENIIDVVV